MSRDRKINLLILASIFLGALFLLVDIKPISGGKKEIEVALGEKFRLKQGQTAKVKDQNILLSITELNNRPYSSWNGPEVILLLVVSGREFKYTSRLRWIAQDKMPYSINMKKSDYRTYADLIIDKPEEACFSGDYYPDRSVSDCLLTLANNLSVYHREWEQSGIVIDYAAICNRLTEKIDKNSCFGHLGGNFADPDKCEAFGEGRDICIEEAGRALFIPEICEKVKVPQEYCLYNIILKGNDIKACNSFSVDAPVFGNLYWSKKCYKDFAQKENQGLAICDQVDAKDKSICLEAMTTAF